MLQHTHSVRRGVQVSFKGKVMSHRVRVYPHNDLFNLAHYQKGVINNKVEQGVEDALSLDCLSCLISLAFTVEALVNFVGNKRVRDWQERKPYRKKISQVCQVARLNFDETVEPFSTLWTLKELRDVIAHGKPLEIRTIASTREELRAAMACPWDSNLNPDFINTAYDQVKAFERLLFVNCKIRIGQTLTSAVGVAA